MPARRTSQDAGGRRQSSPAARLAEITRGGRDHRTRAEGRRGGDFAIMADARRADGRRRDRERGGWEWGGWGRGCPPAARPRDGCGGTAAGPSRWDEERPVRRLRGRSSPPRSRLRGRGQGWGAVARGRGRRGHGRGGRRRGQGRGGEGGEARPRAAMDIRPRGTSPPRTRPRNRRAGRACARGCGGGGGERGRGRARAAARESARLPWTGHRPSRADAARTVMGHVAAEEGAGRGESGRERGAASRGTRQGARANACGRGRRGGTSPPPRWLEREGRDRALRTGPHLRPRETRLRGQGRRIAVRDVPAQEVAAAWEARARAAGREAARLPTVGTSPLVAEAARTVAGHVAAEEVAGTGK